MAIDLTAVFRIVDRGSSQMSKITKGLGSMRSSVLELAGAYMTAQAAVSAFDKTVGAAARYEQSEVAVKAIFNDNEASAAYLAMVDKMAIDSPLLNSTEMLGASKGLVAMTKNVKELGDAWGIIEKLMVLDPTQGTEGAAFALKEMWQGDSLSMVERFGLNKGALNDIKKMSIPKQIAEINKLLDGMGITQQTVNSMGQTTMGYVAQLEERMGKFLRIVGGDTNSKLGDQLEKIVNMLDGLDLDKIAGDLGNKMGEIVDKGLQVAKVLWQWREPIAYVTGAIVAITSAMVAMSVIGMIANPLSLFAGAIAGITVGFKWLYENSSLFKGVVDGIISTVSNLVSAFKSGGFDGLLNAIFGEGGSDKIKTAISAVIGYLKQFLPGWEIFKSSMIQGWDLVKKMFVDSMPIIGSLLSSLWDLMKIGAEIAAMAFNKVIAPAIQFLITVISALWSIASPILNFISGLINVLSAALSALWKNILVPFMSFMYGAFTNALQVFGDFFNIIGGFFDKLSGYVSTAKDALTRFAEVVSAIKLPDWITNGVSTVVETVGRFIGSDKVKSKGHYHGLENVPYNGYQASLHKGEAVLTAQQNREYQSAKQGGTLGGMNITVTGNNFQVRDDNDINLIINGLADKIQERMSEGV